ADPGVHHVEDERLAARIEAGHGLEGEQDSRELAAGGDAGQRTQLLARIRREEELRRLQAALRPRGRVVGGRGGTFRRERDLEPRAFHGQEGELGLDLLFEVAGGTAPLSRELDGRGQIAAGEGLALLAQRALALFGRAQVAQLGPALLAERDDVLDGGAVLALQAVDEGEPALDLVEAARADLERLPVIAEEEGQVIELGADGAARLDVRCEARIDAREVLNLAIQVPQPREHGLFVLVERAVRLARQLGQPARVGLQPLLLAQHLFLAWLERGLLDLDRLVLEHLAAALVLAAVAAQRFQRGLDLAQAAEGLRHRGTIGIEARMVIHEIEVRLRIEQALRLVLAVDVGDERRELAQDAHRNERAVDGGASLSRRLYLPPHHDLVLFRGKSVALECRPRIAALDERLHDGEVFARADEFGRGAGTEQQAQGVDQNRLA